MWWNESSWQHVSITFLQVALWIAALSFWIASLSQVHLQPMNDLGLISVLPAEFFIAVVLLTCGFCLSLRNRAFRGTMLLAHVGLLILFLYGTPAIVEQTPRLAVTWRHLGLIDFIMDNGKVLPRANAYFNWPGFFAVGALFTQAAGLSSLAGLAPWANAIFNALYLGPLLIIYRSATRDSRLPWLAVWFFYLCNWVGQDYLSPQGFDYFLFLALLALLLGPLQNRNSHEFPNTRTWEWFERRAPRAAKFVKGEQPEALEDTSTAWQRVGLTTMAIGIYAAMIPSHQLTPFAALLAITFLALFNRIKPRGLPVLMAVMALTWMSFGAISYFAGHLEQLLSSFGAVDRNVQRGVVGRIHGSPDHVIVVNARLNLTAVIVVLAVVGFVRRLIAGHRDLSIACIALGPVPLALGQYGGEMFLRMFFFSLPALAFFVAALFSPIGEEVATTDTSVPAAARARGRLRSITLNLAPTPIDTMLKSSWLSTITIWVVSLALAGGFLLTRYGNERMDYYTANEVEAARYLYKVAPPGSLLMAPGISVPWEFEGFTTYRTRWLSNSIVRDNDINQLAQKLSKDPDGGYLLMTRSTKATLELYGGMDPSTIAEFQQSLDQSPHFFLIYENSDARVYKYVGQTSDTKP